MRAESFQKNSWAPGDAQEKGTRFIFVEAARRVPQSAAAAGGLG